MSDPYTPEELAKLDAYYNSSESHEDSIWDIAAGYLVKCARCQQPVLISYGAKGSIVCEACEPNDDLEILDDRNEYADD